MPYGSRHPSQMDPDSFAKKVLLILILAVIFMVAFAFKMGGFF